MRSELVSAAIATAILAVVAGVFFIGTLAPNWLGAAGFVIWLWTVVYFVVREMRS